MLHIGTLIFNIFFASMYSVSFLVHIYLFCVITILFLLDFNGLSIHLLLHYNGNFILTKLHKFNNLLSIIYHFAVQPWLVLFTNMSFRKYFNYN